MNITTLRQALSLDMKVSFCNTRLHNKPLVLITSLVVGFCSTGLAQASMFETAKFKISADFRLRGEQDFSSQNSSGVARDDRLRARIRTRVSMNYKASDHVSWGLRLRSGSDDSQQSPHITILDFDDNDTGDADFNWDKWYLKGQKNYTDGKLTGWAGRNSFPFWKPNEMFWDDDVTPAGLAIGYKFNNINLDLNAAYLSLPAGMQEFSGNLAGAQLVYKIKLAPQHITLALGCYDFDANPTDPDNGIYLQNNGTRDYFICVANYRHQLTAWGQPLVLGVDYMDNSESYTAADIVGTSSGVTVNDTNGIVLYAKWGQLNNPGDWLLAWHYAEIEELAVNNSFSQDDWVRWGSATQTRGSNIEGHEFRVAHAFANDVNVVGRLYVVDAITNVEDGNRFRVDLNYKF